ncbi:polysaccharide biosynthesis C-terminal domain-containing protein [Balneola sp. MJW-20]|uniref:oligosaccharide flippase family protein n=1 Tax=Gracilimonas aurantiaca TaxID=3234185 RepID=UPI0034659DA2
MSIASDLKKGALVNFLGVVGKMAAPVFLVVVNRLYGTDVFGLFITATIAIEIVIAFLTSGFKDGAMIFVSRHSDDPSEQSDLYTSLANAFTWSIGLSGLILAIGVFFGSNILEMVYGDDFSEGLNTMFRFMIFAIPLLASERIILAATQGLKIMKYDAISSGWLRPVCLLGCSVLFYYLIPGVTGLAVAYLATQLILCIFALYFYSRELSWSRLFLAFRHYRINKELIDFAIPQNINMTLNRFITGLDVLMLPAFGFSATVVGYYGAGSMIVREVRSVKFIFSNAFAPFIVRLHKEQKYKELSEHFSRTAGWIATIAIPLLLIIAIYKLPVLNFVVEDYEGSATFMYFLLPIPYMYCSFSLAANIVAMTGHSRLTLLNSILVSVTNFCLNLILIPKYGIIGAALASAIAMLALNSLEVYEARKVAHTKLRWDLMYRPHLAGLVASGVLFIGWTQIGWFTENLLNTTALTAIVLATYTALLGGNYLNRLIEKIRSTRKK